MEEGRPTDRPTRGPRRERRFHPGAPTAPEPARVATYSMAKRQKTWTKNLQEAKVCWLKRKNLIMSRNCSFKQTRTLRAEAEPWPKMLNSCKKNHALKSPQASERRPAGQQRPLSVDRWWWEGWRRSGKRKKREREKGGNEELHRGESSLGETNGRIESMQCCHIYIEMTFPPFSQTKVVRGD